jgi:hypothetical protein
MRLGKFLTHTKSYQTCHPPYRPQWTVYRDLILRRDWDKSLNSNPGGNIKRTSTGGIKFILTSVSDGGGGGGMDTYV